MPSLKDVKNKISGVRKTKQITKAMYMVASAKLCSSQTRIERFRAYADMFYMTLKELQAKADGAAHPLLDVHPNLKTVLIVVNTSDRGLCGGFNSNLISRALSIARRAQEEGKTPLFLCVGKKGRDAIRKNGFTIHTSYADILHDLDFTVASSIGKSIMADYTEGKIDEVVLVYGQFESIVKQTPVVLPLLPISQNSSDGTSPIETTAKDNAEYIYEPDVSTLLNTILPRFVNVQIYRALLDTSASENAARMMAMDNATRNCDEMTQSLTLLYNKTRQASITSELIDIVGGAEALQ